MLHTFNAFRTNKSSTNQQQKQAHGLQSTDFNGHIFIYNLQYFKPFHQQSTTKIWAKSTIYKKGTPPFMAMAAKHPTNSWLSKHQIQI